MTKTTPAQFAQLLKTSTLDAKEQLAVLNMLSSLNESQIEELAIILQKDNTAQEAHLEAAESKRDALLLKLSMEYKTMEKTA